MRENGIGGFPHRYAMAKDHPRFGLLYACKENQPPKAILRRGPRNQKSRVQPVLAMPMGGAPLKYGHEPGRWVACDYAVCPAILNEILDKLEVVPERDAFANKDKKDLTNGMGRAVLMWSTPSKNIGGARSYG